MSEGCPHKIAQMTVERPVFFFFFFPQKIPELLKQSDFNQGSSSERNLVITVAYVRGALTMQSVLLLPPFYRLETRLRKVK